MTEEELSAMEARANAATPGPWTTDKPAPHDDGWARGVVVAATFGAQGVFAKNGRPQRTTPTGRVYADAAGGQMPHADQWFIAAARADVPNLLAEVRRLQADASVGLTYVSTQATRCARCHVHKHTPLRRDEMHGYVCLTCIDEELDRHADSPRYSAEAVDALLATFDDVVIASLSPDGKPRLEAAVAAVRASREPQR